MVRDRRSNANNCKVNQGSIRSLLRIMSLNDLFSLKIDGTRGTEPLLVCEIPLLEKSRTVSIQR